MPRHVHPLSVRTDHCTSQYRFFTVSYRPGPVGLWYSPREVCTSVARGTLTVALSTITTAQQDQIAAIREWMVRAEERLDVMWEMILVLEHMQENPIIVDNKETVVSDGVDGEELKVEENEVAVPIPVPGRLVPIEDMVQVLPDDLVDTQITFELADEDHPPSYE